MKLRNDAGQLRVQWCLRYQKPPIGQSDRLRDEKDNPLCSIKGCLKEHGDIAENDPDYPVALHCLAVEHVQPGGEEAPRYGMGAFGEGSKEKHGRSGMGKL